MTKVNDSDMTVVNDRKMTVVKVCVNILKRLMFK